MSKNASQVLKVSLSVLLAAVLLYFAFKGTDWKEFYSGLKMTSWGYVLLSVAAAFIALIFRAGRWMQQLKAIDSSIRFIRIWDGSNIGNFLNILVPGIGEFYRCGHVTGKKGEYDKVFGSIIMERAWDVLAIACLLLGAVLTNTDVLLPFMKEHLLEPFMGRFNVSLWLCLTAVTVIIAGVPALIFAFRKKSRFLKKCADAICGTLNGFLSFRLMEKKWVFVLYTAGIWIMYIFMTFFTFKAVPGLQQLSFYDALFVSAVGNVASVIPTPGNMGAYHYLVALAISSIYFGASGILATPLLFATLSHGSHAVLLIFLGIISYIAVGISKSKENKI